MALASVADRPEIGYMHECVVEGRKDPGDSEDKFAFARCQSLVHSAFDIEHGDGCHLLGPEVLTRCSLAHVRLSS